MRTETPSIDSSRESPCGQRLCLPLFVLLLPSIPALTRSCSVSGTHKRRIGNDRGPQGPRSPMPSISTAKKVTDDDLHTIPISSASRCSLRKERNSPPSAFPMSVAFHSVTEVQGRTIHSDGTVIPLTAKPADLMDYKAKVPAQYGRLYPAQRRGRQHPGIPAESHASRLPGPRTIVGYSATILRPAGSLQFHPHVEPGHYITMATETPSIDLCIARASSAMPRSTMTRRRDTYTIDLD